MTITPEREQKVRVEVDNEPVPTSFKKWSEPGHFDRALARGPKTTAWIWNLHANAHDFDTHTSDLQDVSRKIFAAHFGHLAVVFIWLSGMYFHGARFSNFESWMANPTGIKPSAQVVWPIFGQEILNADVGGAAASTAFKLPLDSSRCGAGRVLLIRSSYIAPLLVLW